MSIREIRKKHTLYKTTDDELKAISESYDPETDLCERLGYLDIEKQVEQVTLSGQLYLFTQTAEWMHDVKSVEDIPKLEAQVIPYFRRRGIDFHDAYRETTEKLLAMREKTLLNLMNKAQQVKLQAEIEKQQQQENNAQEVKNEVSQ